METYSRILYVLIVSNNILQSEHDVLALVSCSVPELCNIPQRSLKENFRQFQKQDSF